MSDQQGEQLTLAERDQLVAELAELEGPRRQEIVEAIAVARAHGDLSENFEYHAAKNEQGLLERRITILQSRLHNAEVIDEEAAAASGVVTVGSKVELEREDGEQMTLDISSVGGVSPESPVGRAVLGKKVGDKIVVEAPRGTWTRPRRLHRAVAAIYPGAVVHSLFRERGTGRARRRAAGLFGRRLPGACAAVSPVGGRRSCSARAIRRPT